MKRHTAEFYAALGKFASFGYVIDRIISNYGLRPMREGWRDSYRRYRAMSRVGWRDVAFPDHDHGPDSFDRLSMINQAISQFLPPSYVEGELLFEAQHHADRPETPTLGAPCSETETFYLLLELGVIYPVPAETFDAFTLVVAETRDFHRIPRRMFLQDTLQGWGISPDVYP